MTLKEKIHKILLKNIDEKINSFQANLDDLWQSVMNETKSTAGDKHETGLAMLQREQSQIAKHLFEAHEEKKLLISLHIDQQNDSIRKGSLVKTNMGNFFMSIAMPKIVIDDITVLAISPKSPLGMQLMGKKPGEQITVNGHIHTIERIY